MQIVENNKVSSLKASKQNIVKLQKLYAHLAGLNGHVFSINKIYEFFGYNWIDYHTILSERRCVLYYKKTGESNIPYITQSLWHIGDFMDICAQTNLNTLGFDPSIVERLYRVPLNYKSS